MINAAESSRPSRRKKVGQPANRNLQGDRIEDDISNVHLTVALALFTCCNNSTLEPSVLQSAAESLGRLANSAPRKLLFGEVCDGNRSCVGLVALFLLSLRASAGTDAASVDALSSSSASRVRRRLASAFQDLVQASFSSSSGARFGPLTVRVASAIVQAGSLDIYCALLHETAKAVASSQQQDAAGRTRVVAPALALLGEALMLLDALSTVAAASLGGTEGGDAGQQLATSLRASPFLDNVCQLVQQLAALPEARQQLAAQLARLGAALRTLHSHDTAAASTPMSPPPLQPCLSYVLSSHVVGLCCALDGEQQAYGLPAVLGSTEPPLNPDAASAAAAWSWSPFAAAASAPLPLFTPEGRPLTARPHDGRMRPVQQGTERRPEVASAQLALAALGVWTHAAASCTVLTQADSQVESEQCRGPTPSAAAAATADVAAVCGTAVQAVAAVDGAAAESAGATVDAGASGSCKAEGTAGSLGSTVTAGVAGEVSAGCSGGGRADAPSASSGGASSGGASSGGASSGEAPANSDGRRAVEVTVGGASGSAAATSAAAGASTYATAAVAAPHQQQAAGGGATAGEGDTGAAATDAAGSTVGGAGDAAAGAATGTTARPGPALELVADMTAVAALSVDATPGTSDYRTTSGGSAGEQQQAEPAAPATPSIAGPPAAPAEPSSPNATAAPAAPVAPCASAAAAPATTAPAAMAPPAAPESPAASGITAEPEAPAGSCLHALLAACKHHASAEQGVHETQRKLEEALADLAGTEAQVQGLRRDTLDVEHGLLLVQSFARARGSFQTALINRTRNKKDRNWEQIQQAQTKMQGMRDTLKAEEKELAAAMWERRGLICTALAVRVPPYNCHATHVLCMRLARAALAAWQGRPRAGSAAAAAIPAAAAEPIGAALADTSPTRTTHADAPAGPRDGLVETQGAPPMSEPKLPADGLQPVAAPRSSATAETLPPAPPPSQPPPPPLQPPPRRPVAVLAAGEAPLVVHAALRCARVAFGGACGKWWNAQWAKLDASAAAHGKGTSDNPSQPEGRLRLPPCLEARLAEWWGLLLQAAEEASCGAGAGCGGPADSETVAASQEVLSWLGSCLAGNVCDGGASEGSGDGGEEGGHDSGLDAARSGDEMGTASPAEPLELVGCVPFPDRPSPDVSAALAAGWLPAVTRMLRRATTQMRAAAAGGGGEDAPAAPALLPLVGAQPTNPAGWEDAWTEVLAFAPSQEDVLQLLDAAEELLRAAVESAGGSQIASSGMACGGGGIGGAADPTEPRLQLRQHLADAVGMCMRLLDPASSEWVQPGTEPGKAPDPAVVGPGIDGRSDNAAAGVSPSSNGSGSSLPTPAQRPPGPEAIQGHDGAADNSDGVSPGVPQLACMVGHAASRLLPAFSQAILRLEAGEGARAAAAGSGAGDYSTACGARSGSAGDSSGGGVCGPSAPAPVGVSQFLNGSAGAGGSVDDVGGESRDGGGGGSSAGSSGSGRMGSGGRAGKGSGKAEGAGCGGSGNGRGMRGGVDGDGKAGGGGNGSSMDALLIAAASQALGWVPWLVTAAAVAANDPASTASVTGDGDDTLLRPDPAAVHSFSACGLLLAAPARWARLLFEEVDVTALLALLMRTLQRAEAASRDCGDPGRSLTRALVSSARLAACRALACLAAAFPDELRRAFGATAAESRSGGAADPAARAPLSWPAVASLLGPAGPMPQPELLAVLRRVVLEGGEVGDGEEARAAMEAAQLGNCMDLLRAGVHDSPTCWS